MLGIINTVTAYYQALGKAGSSLLITTMRTVLLFIPSVILLNRSFGLYDSIAAQPIVETILAVICIFMYLDGQKDPHTNTEQPQANRQETDSVVMSALLKEC